jgi:RHS repeat-associated protein
MLKFNDESESGKTFCSSDRSDDLKPRVYIYYINNCGLEGYWSYRSQDVGRAGTGHVNEYTGNLVFIHDDLGVDGNRMPVSISHVYNVNDKDTNIGYGFGWRLNLSQEVYRQDISGTTYYVHIDSDGTRHYYRWNSTKNAYVNEAGTDTTMVINSGSTTRLYVITDKEDNKMEFDSQGRLVRILDNNNNSMQISYNTGKRIKEIIDGAGRKYILTYNASNYLSRIEYVGKGTNVLKNISYGYDSSGNMTTVTYQDGRSSTYVYNASKRLLLRARNYDGYCIDYAYISGSPDRVQTISENVRNSSGTITTEGGQLNLSYQHNQTTFTDFRGRKEIVQFNNIGNTICVQDDHGRAMYWSYASGAQAKKNQLTLGSKLQNTVTNVLRNPSGERSENWAVNHYEGSTGSWGYTTAEKYIGLQSIRLQKTNNSGRSTLHQTVSLTKGRTYTFSAYVKVTGYGSSSGRGIRLAILNEAVQGENTIVYSREKITGNSDWTRLDVTYTLPSSAHSSNIQFIVEADGTCTAFVDAFQAEQAQVPNRYNLIENADFRYQGASASDALSWVTGPSCETTDIRSTLSGSRALLDNNTFRVVGNVNNNKRVYQDINVTGSAGEVFAFGGWAKADSVPIGGGRGFGIMIRVYHTDGTNHEEVVNFNADSGEWQYAMDRLVTKKAYNRVRILAVYEQNANTAHFDGIQLFKEEFGYSFQYDTNGNVISTVNLANQRNSFSYDSKDRMTRMVDAKGSNFTYTYYDNTRNIKNATSAENVVYSFIYDNSGNPTELRVSGGTLFLESKAAYSTDGNYIAQVTDSSGNIVKFTIDTSRGIQTSVVDANNQETSYTYDVFDRLTSVEKTKDKVNGKDGIVVTNSYTYENDRLKSITHNGFSYNFSYDPMGRNTKVSVGTQDLITNTYEARTGKLLESTYGNGHKISSDYDSLDRVVSDRHNGTVRFRYRYDGEGNLGYHADLVNGVNYRYIYDLAERLVKVVDSKGNSLSYDYDLNNNANKVTETVNGKSYVTSYTFDKDNRPTKFTLHNGSTGVYSYDAIGRVSNLLLDTGSQSYKVTYSYEAGINGSATTRVRSINNNGKIISYTYDKNGNIKTITEGSKVIEYFYNELNELIQENNAVLNKTITYRYDVGGNIREKNEYIYTTDTTLPASPEKAYKYEYGDANWKDKLTNYNGVDIAYDSIGNPISYDGWNFTWEAGRQLKSMSKSGTNVTFKYNSNGIRTEKKVGSVTTTYKLVGDKVTFETNGTDNIYYTYNAAGDLVSMNLNGVEYYYIRNAQGDIIGLLNGSGTQVVSYVYDSWGKLISVTGTLAGTVGVKNPYRYRGYRYDTETGLYYLNSRYYNAEWGHFLNADTTAVLELTQGELLSHNIFAYGMNNPVNNTDESGYLSTRNK